MKHAMQDWRAWSLAPCVLLGLAALAGAPAQAPAQNSLFPTRVGSTWNYVGKVGAQPIMMKSENVALEREGKKARLRQRWFMNGREVQEEVYLVTATTVERKATGAEASNTVNPPLPVLRLPLTTGKTWTWKGALARDGKETAKASAVLKVAGRQTVRLRSGPVSAWRVDMKLTVSAGSQRAVVQNAFWYAPGLGLVKQRTTLRPQGKPLVVEAVATTVKVK